MALDIQDPRRLILDIQRSYRLMPERFLRTYLQAHRDQLLDTPLTRHHLFVEVVTGTEKADPNHATAWIYVRIQDNTFHRIQPPKAMHSVM